MIYIDLPADLHLEDDQGRNVVERVDGGFVHFRQISAQDAARLGSLIKPLPQSV